MKKHLLSTAAMLLGLAALASPAAADIFVTGYIDKDVTITVLESLEKTKDVTITVSRDFLEGESAAEAVGVHNQRTQGNVYNRDCTGCTRETDPLNPPATAGPVGPGGLEAVIGSLGDVGVGSFNFNTGIVLWNQDVGAFSNQANIVTAAIVRNADFAEAYDAASQHIVNNEAFDFGFVVAPATPDSELLVSARIENSVNNNTGVTMINQNAGPASNQYNALTLAVGIEGAVVALAEADLGQFNTGNFTLSINSIRTASIENSVNGNTGVTAVNQNVGNFNNQATKISIAATIGVANGSTPNPVLLGN